GGEGFVVAGRGELLAAGGDVARTRYANRGGGVQVAQHGGAGAEGRAFIGPVAAQVVEACFTQAVQRVAFFRVLAQVISHGAGGCATAGISPGEGDQATRSDVARDVNLSCHGSRKLLAGFPAGTEGVFILAERGVED